MDNYQAEQQYKAAEHEMAIRELMGEYDEPVEPPYCEYCGTALDENDNCPADPKSP